MSELDVSAAARSAASAEHLAADSASVLYGPEPLLRRMLALADVLAIAAAAVVVGYWGSSSAASLLLVLSVPIWVVTAKIAGLYDRDHRTLRHLTVDELQWLVVWALSSTALLTLLLTPFPALDLSADDRVLVWATVLGLAFVFRAGMRALWRRVTPPQRVLIVGDGPLAQAVVRKLELFPDIHARITGRIESCDLLDERLGALGGKIDRIVIACSELKENLLETLLPFCRANGVKLTVVPPTRGMFGTATNLTHIADLPLLDYNTWDISRMTRGLKRGLDVLLAVLGLVLTLPLLVLVAIAIVSRLPWFGPLPANARRRGTGARSRCSSSGRWSATRRRCCRSSSASTSSTRRCSSSRPIRASRASGGCCAGRASTSCRSSSTSSAVRWRSSARGPSSSTWSSVTGRRLSSGCRSSPGSQARCRCTGAAS